MKQLFNLPIIVLLLLLITSLTACNREGSSVSAQTVAPISDPVAGQTLFIQACAACHGPDGQGLPGLGKNLANSEFVTSKSDQELVDFIKVGRAPNDPLNTTGVMMPPKGGRPSLTDEDLFNIVAYLRMIEE